jgi:hypothetical protein
MPLKLYLDDLRSPPEGWALARNVREAMRLVEANRGQIANMSLDHDLGLCYCTPCAFSSGEESCLDDSGNPICGCTCHVNEPSGYDFLKWVHETGNWPTYPPIVHSANPIGVQRMLHFIKDFGPYEKA